MKLSALEKKRFNTIQTTLIGWYKTNRRKFSWRKKIRPPYEVLVCEVMGQQTQASRIEEFLPRFLNRFPTVRSLASAKQSDVIKQWQGLGYNRRALNLHKAAKELSKISFPKKEEELLTLPGIGKYTARAILIFSHNRSVAAVDINIQRLLSRLYKRMPDTSSMLSVEEIYELGEIILPIKQSRLWHEALMDFGATVCTKRNPLCDECPLYDQCKSGKALINASLISKSHSVTVEPKYFGHPKRIWRGKTLKIIVGNDSASESFITKTLQNSFPHPEFSVFIQSILSELMKEGFCEKKNKIYRLRQR